MGPTLRFSGARFFARPTGSDGYMEMGSNTVKCLLNSHQNPTCIEKNQGSPSRIDFIVTGDKHLLSLKNFQNISIVKLSNFLEVLEKKH
jgi:hypothetical protein